MTLRDFPIIPTILVIAAAVLVCITIAVGFGVYPALSAAKLVPVLALQSD